MKTSEKILATARRLFNEQGLVEISLREIARSLEISDGNLRYHFSTKASLVSGLYHALVAELDAGIAEMTQPQTVSLRLLYDSMHFTYACLYRYRFLMQDFVSVMRAHPAIKEHYGTLQIQRRGQFALMVQLYQSQGLIREEAFPGEFDAFHAQLEILSDFWIASAAILYEGPEAEKVAHYTWLNFGAVFPLLTARGQAEFMAMKKEKGEKRSGGSS